tara:strand:- start:903 stop:1100 length:198 start_codon:yes stop_codon:yes gene_type:complete
MYIYFKIGDVYEVGYHLTKYNNEGKPYNQFYNETRWPTPEEAAARVNYLNGGTGDQPVVAVPKEA